MLRRLVRSLVAASLICFVGWGGDGLPALDAVVFHASGRAGEAYRPHYEASSACHADGCAIRAQAQESRLVPCRSAPAFAVLPVQGVAVNPSVDRVSPSPAPHRYFSRAPPASS